MRKVRIRSPTKESPHDRGLSTVTVNRICGNSFVARSLYRIFSRFKRYRGVNMKKHFQDSLMCVWDIRHRKAGSAKIDGKEISWEDADQLIGIPLESSSVKVMKHAILPEKVEVISQKLEHISWGALIQLTFSGKYVTDVEVLCDWLTDFYNED